MSKLAKYGVSYTAHFRLFQPDGIDFEPAATFAAGDIKIMKDGGVEANTTNLPTDEGQGYSLVLTATEMQAAQIVVYIVDATATKVWLDTAIEIDTYGHASAQHAFDFDTPADTAPTGSVATDAGNSATSFKTNLTEAVNDFWKDSYLQITSGALLGQVKKITAYNGTTKIITCDAFTGTPADAVTFKIINE